MSRYQHVLLGGLFIGVVSALPIVGSANVCCCLWVVIGGLLSTYLLQQNRSEPVESGEAAVGGLVAGLLGAIIHIFLQLAVFSVAGAEVETELRQMLERTSEMGPEMREFMARMSSPRNLMLLMAASTLVMYPVFGMLGALLGTVFFRKKSPPTPA
jgi:hypothetical protein